MNRILLTACLLLASAPIALAQGSEAPQTTTVPVRRLVGTLCLLPAGLLYFLHRSRPRPYLKAWMTTWLGLACPLFIGSLSPDTLRLSVEEGRQFRLNLGRAIVATSSLTWMGGMTMLLLAAGWYRAPMRWPRWLAPAALLTSLWVIGGALTVGLIVVFQAAWVLGAALFFLGGIAYLRLAVRERLFGAFIMGTVLLLVPVDMISNGLSSLTRGQGAVDIWVWILVYAFLALGMHVLAYEDVTWELRQRNEQLRTAQAELKARAVTDPLTGCYNRRFFDEIAAHELKRHQRYKLPLALLFFDCDQFKAVNDLLGHDAGDRVLATIGHIIRTSVRESDYVFRWGGDEFLALITADEDQAATRASQITDAFAKDASLQQLPPGTGLTVGHIVVPADASDLLPFVQLADERMYAQKRRSA